MTSHWGAFTKPLLQWERNKYYIFMCVRASMRVSWGAWVYACARAPVALLVQHATRLFYIVCHLWPLWLHHIFRHYLIKNVLTIKCVFWFSLRLSKTFLIIRIIQRDIVINVNSLHVKYPLFLSDFNATWMLSTDSRKKAQISHLIKIHPVGAELFHEDRRTDTTKLIIAFAILRTRIKMKTVRPWALN